MMQLGLDIGGTSIKAAIFRNGRCVSIAQSTPYSRPTVDELRAVMGAAVENARAVDAVGLCLPGSFDVSTRRLTHCVNVPALTGVHMDSLVRKSLHLPRRVRIRVCGDAVAAAYDIRHSRRLIGRLLVLALGTGVGCGVLDGHEALDVDEGSSGHFGQIDVSLCGHDVIGPDGGAGGLEGYIGAPALQKRHPGVTPADALARYAGDEPPVRALVRALRIAHAIYRPRHICLCGGIGLALRRLLPAIRKQVQTHLTSLARPGWTLTCGNDLYHAARGAARLAALREI